MSRNAYCDHIKTGRSHLRRLATMQRHLLDMADAWEDLDTCQITEFNALADRVGESTVELTGLMEEWKNSKEWDGE
ncbi:hypothetical protein [Rahnella sp. ChDrAdgB13]|uniref:hypothetical protein n=1 Tax=Rahnella sp. ChDrAdgB13 TaxID=1850581 RepID=UPI001AD89260|nr:hypothetical protein [Rahnella sp. ChDrAdgB13]